MTDLYTDGSNSMKTGLCSWAVVGTVKGQPVRRCGYLKGTNQVAELTAVKMALLSVPEGDPVKITTDSMYCVNGCTVWRQSWENSGFINYSGRPISNLQLWRETHAAWDARKPEIHHVKGHSGHEWNELADKLAGLARAIAEGRLPASVISSMEGYELIGV